MKENFAHLLENNARRFGEKTAVLWEKGDLSWRELDRRASGFARRLAGQSVGPGDRVAILIPNNWSFVVAFLATLKVGATAAPLSPELKREEIDDLLADLRPKRIIDDVPIEEGSWETPPQAAAPAVIVYTSGSTGRPKGAVFSHDAVLFGVRSWAGSVMSLNDRDVVLGVLPFSHNYGMYAGLLAPLLCGSSTVLIEHFTPESVLAAIEKQRVTIFPGVATMFRRLLNSPSFAAADLSNLRLATSGAAPCSAELCCEWHRDAGVKIICGYGATEVPRTISFFADDQEERPSAAGRIMPGVQIRVIDDEGKALPQGAVGELLINSPSAMEGYLDRPAETAEVLSEGWFHSGDIGVILPGEFVQIVGRKRERILRGGFSVFPQEVETVMQTHESVAEVAVVGIPHADLGEEIIAFVTLKPSTQATEAEIFAHGKEHLAHHKYPRKVVILPELPRGTTGKVLKTALLQRYVAH